MRLIRYFILIAFLTGSSCTSTDQRTVESLSNTPITPGSKAIQITVGSSEPNLLNKTIISWGIENNQGQFISSDIAQFDRSGGTLVGEILRPKEISEIVVSLAVDYRDDRIPDNEFSFKCIAPTQGLNVIFPVSSSFRKTTFYLIYTPSNDRSNHILIDWRYQDDEDNATPINVTGNMRVDSETLLKGKGVIPLDIVFPVPILRRNSGFLSYRISGSLSGVAIGPSDTTGRVQGYSPLITLDIRNPEKVKSSVGPRAPSEATLDRSEEELRRFCREVATRSP